MKTQTFGDSLDDTASLLHTYHMRRDNVQEQRRLALRERLMTGYQASAHRDQALADEWRPLEEEVWREYVGAPEEKEGRRGASGEEILGR
jgi:hypothetical protein